MRAFEEMQNLEYKSDIDAFNVAAYKAITELAASGATMESIMMICIRNAFHSGGQYIRMEIGKDMDDNLDMGISQVLDLLHKIDKLFCTRACANHCSLSGDVVR